MEPIRSASEWEPICDIKVVDPDGWDRKNFSESWAEPITKREFIARSMVSTTTPYKSWGAL